MVNYVQVNKPDLHPSTFEGSQTLCYLELCFIVQCLITMHWVLQLGKETGTRGSGLKEPDVLDSLTCKQALWVVVHAGYIVERM